MNDDACFEQVCRHARGTAVLATVEAALGWDEQTMLPRRGAEHRGEQAAAIAALVHQRWLDPVFGEQLEMLRTGRLAAGEASDTAVTIRRLAEEVDRRRRTPARLVEELASVTVAAQHVWLDARRDAAWLPLAPWLERIFALKREQAACRAPDLDAYDALLDEYEPGGRAEAISRRFDRLRAGIVPLVQEIAEAPRRPDTSLMQATFPRDRQEAFVREVAARIGFDFDRGRLDTAAHPFCSSLGPHDCRITTRWDERSLATSLYGVLHEAGHGLYEQGLRDAWHGLPPGEAASLGVHESQSRLWENLVGRSLAFWKWCLPLARQYFPNVLSSATPQQVHEAMLQVQPSMIRVEADEVTYNLHIMLRFDLERAVVRGQLPVAELPAAWNERFEQDFGLAPRDDAEGVLQDIHWSAGLVGYFPTYTLGNIYAAELMAAAEESLPSLGESMENGDFSELLAWLRSRVHQFGRSLDSDTLVAQATGRPPTEERLLASLRRRYGPVHGCRDVY